MLRAVFGVNSLAGNILTAVFCLLFMTLFTSSSFSADTSKDPFTVSVDQAKLLHLPKQGSTIIVGNPSIADVSVQNGKLLVITGKSYGITNLIVLDSGRKTIINQIITVVADKKQVVQLYKGSMRQSYACQPKCASVINIGDEAEYVKNLVTTTTNKTALASGGTQQGQSPGQ